MRGFGPSRIPLTARVPLLTALLMVLMGMFASQQVLGRLAAVQEQGLRELARMQIEGLSTAVAPDVLRNDIWEIFDTLNRSAAATAGMRTTMTVVADAGGLVLAASDPHRAPTGSPIEAFACGAGPVAKIALVGSATTFRILEPLTYQGRKIGSIAAEIDVSDILAERHRAAMLLILANAGATLVLAVVGYALMRRMLRPVAVLGRHIRNGSDDPQRIPDAEIPRGDTELSRLFRAYNRMADSVARRGEAERRLAERERFVSLGRLSSSLAHEINNPLGGMLNATDTILRYADHPQEVIASAGLLQRGLRHMRDVVRVTLETNRAEPDRPLNGTDLEDLHLLISPEIARRNQHLDWQVPTTCPECPDLAAGPVRQIALNLLLNASEAAGNGGWLRFHAAVQPSGLTMTVEDNGTGLPVDARARLLEDGPIAPGGGVGLRLVREMTQGLRGRIAHARAEGITRIEVILTGAEA
jgi:signal transduction histidine kinase